MKVIFLEDVPKVAKAGDVKEVAQGYARNYLIPKKLAAPATPSATNLLEMQNKIRERHQKAEKDKMQELANQLQGKEITIRARVGEQERLFGSVTSADIAAELEKAGFAVDKRKIELEDPIKQLGNYEVTIRLTKDIAPEIKVTVAPMEAEQGA